MTIIAPSQPFLSLDLEMNQPSGRIIQVGVAVGKRGQQDSEYLTRSWLLSPSEPIAPNITALTGISDEHIARGAVPLEQMAQELSALITEHTPFINPVTWGGGDTELLLRTIRESGLEFLHFGRRWLDVKTMASVDAMAQGRKPTGGLGSVMGRYKLSVKGTPHRADVDAFNTLRLFFHLLDQRARLHTLVEQAKLA
jgi:DNA polymerase III epsilon subunit-like protein